MKYTKDILATAARNATSVGGVLRNLGLRHSGGNYSHIKRRLEAFGIDTSHFPSPPSGRHRVLRRTSEEILTMRPADAPRPHGDQLRRAMRQCGVAYRCQACGVAEEWQGRPITLHVDHVDGEFRNCLLENLRFLCPNCHSQTSTYGRRKGSLPRLCAEETEGVPALKQGRPEVLPVVRAWNEGLVTRDEAARRLGCAVNTLVRLRKHLLDSHALPSLPSFRVRRDQAIVEAALTSPENGPKGIAAALAAAAEPIMVSTSVVFHVLRKHGLGDRVARMAAADRRTGSG